jgi:hypothetical protein
LCGPGGVRQGVERLQGCRAGDLLPQLAGFREQLFNLKGVEVRAAWGSAVIIPGE